MNNNDTFDHLPPHSTEAEMCAIASMMLDKHIAAEILGILDGESFYLTDHTIIYNVIRDLMRSGRPVDAVILRDELKKQDQLDAIGGSAYIAQILGTVPSAAHGIEYANRVREKASLRAIITQSDNARRRAYAQESASSIIADHQASLTEVCAQRTAGDILDFSDVMAEAYESVTNGGIETIPFGIRDLDARTGGIARGEVVIVGARPSMGKSTLLRTIALNVASEGYAVGLISLEEGPQKIGRNALASRASIDNNRLRKGEIEGDEINRLARAAVSLGRLPIKISRKARTLDEIRAVATTMRSKHGVDLIIIDHLAKVRAPGKSLYEQVTEASDGITEIIQDLNVAGIVASQLSRASARKPGDKRPDMEDLRESGAIEQNADGIILLHREDYYGQKDDHYVPTGIAELQIAKWRDGLRGGAVKLRSELPYQRFSDAADAWDSDGQDREAA